MKTWRLAAYGGAVVMLLSVWFSVEPNGAGMAALTGILGFAVFALGISGAKK